jgi:predicted XRE-type DNA-binding protein
MTKVRRGSDNVFADLGFGPEEAAHLKIRADLMVALTKLLKARGWTQAKAAAALGVSQPRVSDLMRGRAEKFSIDTLVAMLNHAGARVKFVVQRRRQVA